MEYGLGQDWEQTNESGAVVVLILVLMEYGLGLTKHQAIQLLERVLILVLMEYGLGR